MKRVHLGRDDKVFTWGYIVFGVCGHLPWKREPLYKRKFWISFYKFIKWNFRRTFSAFWALFFSFYKFFFYKFIKWNFTVTFSAFWPLFFSFYKIIKEKVKNIFIFKHHNELNEWNEFTSSEVLKFSREGILFFGDTWHMRRKSRPLYKRNFWISFYKFIKWNFTVTFSDFGPYFFLFIKL